MIPIFDPNLAYVLLVVGLILSLLAFLTPGTGVVEIGSLFAIVIAGYGIVSTPTNYWAVIFLILIFPLLFLYRKRKADYWLIALIISLNIGAFAIFRGESQLFSISPLLAIAVVIADSLVLWFVVKKIFEAIDTAPVFVPQSIIGSKGEARTQIAGEGTVYVNGEEWTARSKDLIPKNTKIVVI